MTLSSVKNGSLSRVKAGHALPHSLLTPPPSLSSLAASSTLFPFKHIKRKAMSTFCPFTAPVVTPPFSWRESTASMSFGADVYYLAALWGITLPRGEHSLQDQDQHLEEPKEVVQKGHRREFGELFRRATAKTFRYARRDSYYRHKDNTYIVLNDLTGDGFLQDTRTLTESHSDSVTGTSFRSSLSLRAERLIRRRRK
jgi:hypothetical protein